VSNMKDFHRERVLRQMQDEFRRLSRLLNKFEKRLDDKGVKR
jgi:ribosomal protein S15P/S13E